MKKLLNQKFFTMIAMLFTFTMMLASCSNNTVKSYDVTFYNGETVLKVEKVEENKCATNWTPEVEGYTFEKWYGTPTFTHEFDFTTPITANTEVFGKFLSNVVTEDVRSFYVVGSGTSPVLLESNWGKVINDSMKLTKDNEKNEYSITLDLYVGDQFQFAINSSWENQRGVGYLKVFELDGEEVFKNPGSAYGNDSRRSNIEVKKSGNYTLTLLTHPDEDYYDTNNANYTEAGKENFNLNDYDTMTWVRNGDAEEPVDAITTYYIKGSGITTWKDIYNNHTRMNNEDGINKLSIFLQEGEEFLFTSMVTVGDKISTGTEYLRYSNLDEEAKELLDATASYNMVAKASGVYDFSYNESTKVISVIFTAGSLTPTDFYVDGTFGDETSWSGYCFNENYRLIQEEGTNLYKLANVVMKQDSEFIIQAFKAGSTERGEWGTDSYNGLGSYNYNYLLGDTELFEKVSSTNNNIKVLKAGAYDITFDAYSQIITVIEHVEEVSYDVYIKGGMNNWSFNFLDEWKLKKNETDSKLYEIVLDFSVDWEVGLAVYNEGETTGYGEWVGLQSLGVDGDANDKFVVASGNLKCNTAGKYKVVYNSETKKIDFYVVE